MELSASVCVIDSLSGNAVHTRPKAALLMLRVNHSGATLKIVFSDSSKEFKLTNNIVKLYARYFADGNLTIRLRVPAKDIMLRKADPNMLAKFLKMLNDLISGVALAERSISMTGSLSKSLLNPRKMHIKRRDDYPLGKSFPTDLRELNARSLKLRTFDPRLLALSSLCHLELGVNQIEQIPVEIARLNLSVLCLEDNMLTAWPSIEENSPLARSLEILDLSRNKLDWLPDDFWILKCLTSVNLSHMGLRGLPAAYLHHVRHLTNLRLDDNHLTCLPFSVSLLSQCTISVCNNRFVCVDPSPEVLTSSVVPTLVACSSQTCARTFSLDFLQARLPWRLYVQFAVFRRCLCCRKFCGIQPERVILSLPRSYTLCCDRDNLPSFICHLCCTSCVHTFRQYRWKYIPS
ncbi:LRR-repeat protein 1 [Paragonimus westermani]|uniref:LRR-repeat protein 1 n=1 Tax=Paragonimus westermani TaxID=34504 RepID=A0A5J4NEX8_9TREM|nr:LRR-repeat protein 1 [Paragonimus westermani]